MRIGQRKFASSIQFEKVVQDDSSNGKDSSLGGSPIQHHQHHHDCYDDDDVNGGHDCNDNDVDRVKNLCQETPPVHNESPGSSVMMHGNAALIHRVRGNGEKH